MRKKKKTAAVVLDDWKLETFESILADEGFETNRAGPFAPGATTLEVVLKSSDVQRLHDVLKKCKRRCDELRN